MIVAKELLVPVDSFGGFYRHQSVPSFCVLTHQDPALLQLLSYMVLLQLLLYTDTHTQHMNKTISNMLETHLLCAVG